MVFDKGGQLPKELTGKYIRVEEAINVINTFLVENPEKNYKLNMDLGEVYG